jgi:nicotinamide-nucleotide amidase
VRVTTATTPDATMHALAAELGHALLARGWRVTVAESCTGGLGAAAITSVAGSSDWFEVGYVTYSNGAKTALLGVPEAVLVAHGAVSEQTARAMAEGALAKSGADIAAAVTGIAGPTGGTPAKPVGTVCFAWAAKGRAVESTTRRFDGDRASVRSASASFALQGLLDRVRRR